MYKHYLLRLLREKGIIYNHQKCFYTYEYAIIISELGKTVSVKHNSHSFMCMVLHSNITCKKKLVFSELRLSVVKVRSIINTVRYGSKNAYINIHYHSLFFLNILLDPLFRTSDDSAHGFKARLDSLSLALFSCLCTMIPRVIPGWLLGLGIAPGSLTCEASMMPLCQPGPAYITTPVIDVYSSDIGKLMQNSKIILHTIGLLKASPTQNWK